MGFSAYEYEHTYHLTCLNNSHYSNTHALSAVWVFAVITPYWAEKGWEKMRYSEQFMEHIEYAFNAFCKIVLRHEAINAWRDLKRKEAREISLDLHGFASTEQGQAIETIVRPRKRASNRPQNTIWQTPFISISRKRRSALPGSPIFSLKPPHSCPCPTKQRYCTPLSCVGRSYPARTAGWTNTGAFICIIPSARWSLCSTVGGRKRSTPCRNCSMRSWLTLKSRAVENPTAFTQNPMKRFQTPSSRNPVPVRRRAENRTLMEGLWTTAVSHQKNYSSAVPI